MWGAGGARTSCDTFVVLGDATADGGVIFGKNSDREPNEACRLVHLPAVDHFPPSSASSSSDASAESLASDAPLLRCTHVSIPQVAHTNAVLLCQPCHIWGAEMGANEHGLVIGNEATFSCVPQSKEAGFIGMDLVRLALERAADADSALSVIITLLEKYGQGGNCGFNDRFTYNSAFLICDRSKAIVLETVGREWIYREFASGIVSISNCYSIGDEWDACSDGLRALAARLQPQRSVEKFNFAYIFSDLIYTTFAKGRERSCRVRTKLEQHHGHVSPLQAFDVLRDHGTSNDDGYDPARNLHRPTICMHKSAGPLRAHQTTSSLVVHLSSEHNLDEDVIWVTGTSSPCVSTFKPIIGLDAFPNEAADECGRSYDQESRWWRHERWYRQMALGSSEEFNSASREFREASDELEDQFLKLVNDNRRSHADERAGISRICFAEADKLEEKSLHRLRGSLVKSAGLVSRLWSLVRLHHTSAWMFTNHQVEGLTESEGIITPHVFTPHHLMALGLFLMPVLVMRYARNTQ